MHFQKHPTDTETNREMVPRKSIGLPPEMLDTVFPFHFFLDGAGTVVEAGSILCRLIIPLVGWSLDSLFCPVATDQSLDFETLWRQKPVSLNLKVRLTGLNLSGSFLAVESDGVRHLLFLGTPAIETIKEAEALEKQLIPYAAQPAVGEYLRTLHLCRVEMVGAIEDTERQRQRDVSRYQSVIDSLSQVVFQTDADESLTFLNPAWAQITGYDFGQSLGYPLDNFVVPEDLSLHRENMASLIAGRRTECRYLIRFKTSLYGAADVPYDDTLRWIGVNIRTVADEKGGFWGISGTLTDISERKRAEKERADALNERLLAVGEREAALEALRENETYLRTLITHAPLILFAVDTACVFTLVEGSGLASAGLKPEKMLKRSIYEVYSDRADIRKDIQRALQGETVISITEMDTHLFETRYSPIRLADGAINGCIGVSTDITDRVRAEERLRELAIDLQRSNQVLQDFASVASHDLQEPLRKIQAFGGRLKRSIGETMPADAGDYLERMLGAAGRMQLLLNDLLAFSRVTTKGRPFIPTDLNEVAAHVRADLEARIQRVGGKVEIESLPIIEADPLQMRQLLLNLLTNSLKFTRENVPPVVKVRAQIVRGSGENRRILCRLVVEDNGTGFDQKYSERVFEVFERLHSKGDYEGTGMGLAICKKIVERHGGEISARSAPGIGSTFTVLLPVKADVSDNRPADLENL